MPEIWFPYGDVETLLTVQAENLGTVVDSQEAKGFADLDRLADACRKSSAVFVCDFAPSTLQLLKELATSPGASAWPKTISLDSRKLENLVPEVKGRTTTAQQAAATDPNRANFLPDLLVSGPKVFVGTARPDPLFGISGPVVESCLNWVVNSKKLLAQKAPDFEPRVFEKTEPYEEAEGLLEHVSDSTFITVVPRAGKLGAVVENAPFDAIRHEFQSAAVPPGKALVASAGGSGYDDTLSSALRVSWSALRCLRRSGTLLLLAECSAGLGSRALEMLATGRLTMETKRKEAYVDGLEDVTFLAGLVEDYDVLLLSGLPELYVRSKLGLGLARSSAEAWGKLLNKVGRTAKVNLVTRAAELYFESAQGQSG